MGVGFDRTKKTQAYFGADIEQKKGTWSITSNPLKGSAAYQAELSFGDQLISMNNKPMNSRTNKYTYFSQFEPNQTVSIKFIRFNEEKETSLTFESNPSFETFLIEKANKKEIKNRNAWLH
jgi:predicted metalloprotease with PDZ domain